VAEKMIPASEVRRIAREYGRRNNWCSEVERALADIGALDDELVEVTFTQTRVVRVLKSDVDKLRTAEELTGAHTDEARLRSMFKNREAPDGATLVSARWTASDPVEAGTGEWRRFPLTGPRVSLPGDAVGARIRIVSENATGDSGTPNHRSVGALGTLSAYVYAADSDGDVHPEWDDDRDSGTNYILLDHIEYQPVTAS
jgi:hypothetical protein